MVMRRLLVIPAVVCALSLAVAPQALADAPSQISGTYAVTGFQVESVTLVGTNMKVVVEESGTFGGDIQGDWFWEPNGIAVGVGFGASHGIALCSPCTIGNRTGSFMAVEGSGTFQPSVRFTITAAYGGLAGLHGDLITTGGAVGTYNGTIQFT